MVYIIKNTKWHSQTGGNIDFGFSSRKKYPLSIIQELPVSGWKAGRVSVGGG